MLSILECIVRAPVGAGINSKIQKEIKKLNIVKAVYMEIAGSPYKRIHLKLLK
jgi:hypothetical protein